MVIPDPRPDVMLDQCCLFGPNTMLLGSQKRTERKTASRQAAESPQQSSVGHQSLQSLKALLFMRRVRRAVNLLENISCTI